MNSSREQLINLYIKKYDNIQKIKAYQNLDASKLKSTFDNLKDKYIDFLYELINYNRVTFAADYKHGSCEAVYYEPDDIWLITCYAKINDGGGSTLFHEIGHMVDYVNHCSYKNKNASMIYKIQPEDRTLNEILREELKSKKDLIYNSILEEYKRELDLELGSGTFDSIKYLVGQKEKLEKMQRKLGGEFAVCFTYDDRFTDKLSPELNEYWKQFEQNVEEKINPRLENIKNSKAYRNILSRYGIILDCLSAVMDLFSPYNLNMHSKNYYKKDKTDSLLAMEFFANMFQQEVSINTNGSLELVEKLLPNSYKNFYILLDKIIELRPKHRHKSPIDKLPLEKLMRL